MKFPKDSEFVSVLGWDEALYKEALSWVDETRRAAFVVDREIESEDPRVKFYVLESMLQWEGILKKIAWSAVMRKMSVIGTEEFRCELERVHLAAHLIISEAADFWERPLSNARANRSSYRRGMELKGAFEGIPALIVGAGPSIEKNGHLLREFENRALIFAGGSALNVIDAKPHFAGSIDADAPYRQFKTHPFSEIPFCYQARMNQENFSLLHGEKVLFPDSSSEAINWLFEEEPFDGGWTVGNFMTAIALHMGCSPIIFAGMDLCYQQGKKYGGIQADLPDGLIQVGDVMTQKDWLMGARWTEALGKNHHLIDATEGGILRIPKEKLSSVLKSLSPKGDLHKKAHDAIQRLPLHDHRKRWNEWDASLMRCKKNIENLDDEVVYHKLLVPLWQIWKPIFEREVDVDPKQKLELHRNVFFQTVLEKVFGNNFPYENLAISEGIIKDATTPVSEWNTGEEHYL